jgi:hypothetical protein
MNDDTDRRPDVAAGMPRPDPPKGGPNKDPKSPNPADLAPGFGGTSKSRPASTEDDTADGDDKD